MLASAQKKKTHVVVAEIKESVIFMIDKFEGKYAFLSNFYPSPIRPWEDDIIYPTVEHAFQAMKTFDIEKRRQIASQPTPGKAKFYGRSVELRLDWREIRDKVMYFCLKDKFEDSILKDKLLATGNEFLVEGNSWHDNYWGDCRCPKCKNIQGENHLGYLLMEIRDEKSKKNIKVLR